jgi:hypothetical protein
MRKLMRWSEVNTKSIYKHKLLYLSRERPEKQEREDQRKPQATRQNETKMIV